MQQKTRRVKKRKHNIHGEIPFPLFELFSL